MSDKSDALALSFVKREEGLVLVPYRDAAGLWTVGYGHRCGPGQKPMTKLEAEAILSEDMRTAREAVERVPGLSENQAAALVSFVFNVGVSAFEASTLRRKLIAADWAGAADEFLRWVHVHKAGVKIEVAGLRKRRERERALFLNCEEGGVMDWMKNRLLEVSTWRGLGAFAVTLGLASAGTVDVVISAGMALLSLVEVVRAEKK